MNSWGGAANARGVRFATQVTFVYLAAILIAAVPTWIVIEGLLLAIPGEHGSLLDQILLMRWYEPFVCAAVMLPILPLNALRWGAIIRSARVGKAPPVIETSGYLALGAMLTTALPGVSGEVVPAFLARRNHGLPLNAGLATHVYSRLTSMTLQAAVAWVLWATTSRHELDEVTRLVLTGGVMLVLGTTVCVVAFAAAPQVTEWVAEKLALIVLLLVPKRLHRLRMGLARYTREAGATGRTLRAVIVIGFRPLVWAMVFSVLIVLVYAGSFFVAARFCGGSPTLAMSVLVQIVSQFVSTASFVVPGGVGGPEVVLVSLGRALVGDDWGKVARFVVLNRLSVLSFSVASVPLAFYAIVKTRVSRGELDETRGIRAGDELRRHET